LVTDRHVPPARRQYKSPATNVALHSGELSLGLAGVFLVATRRRSRAYIADAAVEAGFAAAWLASERRRPDVKRHT
jgi:hypothetical protein